MTTKTESDMKGTEKDFKGNTLLRVAFTFAVFGYVAAFGARAEAQFAQPLGQPPGAATYTQPNTAPTPGPAPPIGNGTTAPAEIQGDTGTAPTVPNPGADTTDGVGLSNFTTDGSHDMGIIYLYHQQQPGADGVPRGMKMVQTINPATLTANDWGQIQGIVGAPNGTAATNVQVTDAQLAQIQQILAPYPGTSTEGNGLKVITADEPATIAGAPTAHYNYDGVLPTVRTFSKYLVILGVVVATVWMSLGAYSMVLGHPYAGSRVIGTAAGLILLLSGYTIWKIVKMNTFNDNTTDNAQALLTNSAQPTQATVAPSAQLNTDPVPAAPTGRANRSGLPVQPLFGKGN
jgi:hypothetical protein